MENINIYPDKYLGEDSPSEPTAKRLSYFYIHGELENKSGYDCFDSDWDNPKIGIHEAIVRWPDGTTDSATLYVRNSIDPRGILAGIAVKSDNADDQSWARGWYNKTQKSGGNY
jgi:hypothetical protein